MRYELGALTHPVEEQLRASEAKYHMLFDSIDEGFCIIEVLFDCDERPLDYRFLEVNPAFVRQTGLHDAVGRRMRDLAPEHESHWFEIYGRIALTGEPARFENRARALDDRWYDVFAFRVGGPEEHKVGVLFNDVSQRKRADDALRESEERLRLLVENVHEYALLQTDLQGRVVSWNPGATRLFQYTSAEMLGHSVARLLTPEDRPSDFLERHLSVRARNENARWLMRKDGTRFWARWVTEAVTDAEGRVRGRATILRDETDLRRAEQDRERLLMEMERSNQELARFSYAVSHDLQAPVRTIQTFTQLLARRAAGRLEAGDLDLLTKVTEASEGMRRLIEALLRYAQTGQGQLSRETVSVDDVVASVQSVLASDIAEAGASLTYGPLPIIEADRVQLEQLFQNLIANAIRYRASDRRPAISVSGEVIHGGWRFAVADNGEGIPPEYQDQIFEPLKRLHGHDRPGSGLGLALCRTIVERHGGRIWVDSPGRGHGSTFWFVIAQP